jgi:hypothetical protein
MFTAIWLNLICALDTILVQENSVHRELADQWSGYLAWEKITALALMFANTGTTGTALAAP